jgi:hypothetical protein
MKGMDGDQAEGVKLEDQELGVEGAVTARLMAKEREREKRGRFQSRARGRGSRSHTHPRKWFRAQSPW